MYKKSIIIGLILATVAGLLIYINIVYIKSENKKVQDDMQSRINTLQQDRENLEKKVEDIKEETAKAQIPKGSLQLVSAQIQSNDVYKEGTVNGAIYGSFNVGARVKNISNTEVKNIKVAAVFLKSNSAYEREIGADSKALGIESLAPGEEKEVLFTGFKVVHPETQQEVIVNVFNPSSADINDISNVKKINLKVAFPPGSND